jgi:hypothetical protein
MESFGIGRAWSLGYRLFTGRALIHALILIGVGIAAPLALQFAALGTLVGSNPMLTGTGGMSAGAGAAAGAAMIVVMGLSYLLQTGSYFASWRLGLARDSSPGGALLYGLPASLLAMAIVALAIALAAAAFGQLMEQPGLALILGIIAAVPVILASALFYTLMSAMIAVAVSLGLVLLMAVGTATGNIGLAATLVGGSGAVAVALVGLSLVWLWLAARLSCTAAIMAERRSFNLVAAMRESWQLTWEDQCAILRYLALLGLCVMLILFAAMFAVGVGAAAAVNLAPDPQQDTLVFALIGLVVAIPLAYLAVMIPGGIYRSLNSASDDAAIFA